MQLPCQLVFAQALPLFSISLPPALSAAAAVACRMPEWANRVMPASQPSGATNDVNIAQLTWCLSHGWELRWPGLTGDIMVTWVVILLVMTMQNSKAGCGSCTWIGWQGSALSTARR